MFLGIHYTYLLKRKEEIWANYPCVSGVVNEWPEEMFVILKQKSLCGFWNCKWCCFKDLLLLVIERNCSLPDLQHQTHYPNLPSPTSWLLIMVSHYLSQSNVNMFALLGVIFYTFLIRFFIQLFLLIVNKFFPVVFLTNSMLFRFTYFQNKTGFQNKRIYNYIKKEKPHKNFIFRSFLVFF